MSDLKPFMLAAIYGEPPTQSLRQAVFLAPSRELAIAMFVSASHVQQGEGALCVAISVDEIRQDVVEAARRGFVGEAPVVSLASEREGRETLRGAQAEAKVWPPCSHCGSEFHLDEQCPSGTLRDVYALTPAPDKPPAA